MATNFGPVPHAGKTDEMMGNETVRKSCLGEES